MGDTLSPGEKIENEREARRQAEAELASRELCRRRLLPLILRLKPDYIAGWFHKDLAARLERFVFRIEAGESPKMIINVPPRHGKSEQASKCLIAWALGRNPTWPFIAATHSDKLAVDNSRDVLQYLRDERYKAVFPGLELDKDNKGATGWRTTAGGAYKPVGVGAGIAGYGAKVLIIDDPHRDRDAYSATVRETLWRWYKSSARTRLMPGAGQLLIQNRWVLDDMTGMVLEEEGRIEDGGEWEVVCYPAQATEDEWRLPNGIISHTHVPGAELLRKKGEFLHPARYDYNALKQHMEDPVTWQALFQQDPTAGDAATFTDDCIHLVDKADVPKNLAYYTTVDLAISMTERSDFTVLLHCGLDSDDNLWVVEMQRGRWSTMEILDHIFDSYTRYRQEFIGIEKGQLQMAIQPLLDKVLGEKIKSNPLLSYMDVGELDHYNKDKLARTVPIKGRMQQKKVFIVQDEPWSPIFLKELREFPAGRHDDCVDTLAWQGMLLFEMVGHRTVVRPKPKKSWKDKLTVAARGRRTFMSA